MKLFFFLPLRNLRGRAERIRNENTSLPCNENRGFHYSIDVSFSADRCFYDSSTNRWSRLIIQLKFLSFHFVRSWQITGTHILSTSHIYTFPLNVVLQRSNPSSIVIAHSRSTHVSLLQMSRSTFSTPKMLRVFKNFILILYTSLSRHEATRKRKKKKKSEAKARPSPHTHTHAHTHVSSHVLFPSVAEITANIFSNATAIFQIYTHI